jgi:hypothetical protein
MLLALIGSTRVSAVVSGLSCQLRNGLLTDASTETLQHSERLCQTTTTTMMMIKFLLMSYSGVFEPAIETARRRRGKTHRKNNKGHFSEVRRQHFSFKKY